MTYPRSLLHTFSELRVTGSYEVRIGPVQPLGASNGHRCMSLFACNYRARGER